MTNYNFDKSEQDDNSRNDPYKVSFFGLKDDGDSAIVRFPYKSSKEIDYAVVHSVKIGNGYRNVVCLAGENGNRASCPLCEEGGTKAKLRFFIKLLVYTRDEKGAIIPEAKTWERPVAFANELHSYCENYGDLSDIVFMLKRHGTRGSMQTTYSLLPLKAEVYPETIYKKDFSAFEGFNFNNYIILNKTAEEMKAFIASGDFPKKEIPTQVQKPTNPLKEGATPTPIARDNNLVWADSAKIWSSSASQTTPSSSTTQPISSSERAPSYSPIGEDPTSHRTHRYTEGI